MFSLHLLFAFKIFLGAVKSLYPTGNLCNSFIRLCTLGETNAASSRRPAGVAVSGWVNISLISVPASSRISRKNCSSMFPLLERPQTRAALNIPYLRAVPELYFPSIPKTAHSTKGRDPRDGERNVLTIESGSLGSLTQQMFLRDA